MAGRTLGSRNKTRRITDVQLHQLVTDYRAGKGTEKLAVPLGVHAATVARWLRAAGVVLRPSGFQRGEDHVGWAGGRTVSSSGYVLARVYEDDPFFSMATKKAEGASYASEHRLVLARRLGRLLLDHETVHHIDGDKKNNHPDNLQLRQGRHGKGVVLCCSDCGSRNITSAPF